MENVASQLAIRLLILLISRVRHGVKAKRFGAAAHDE